jgi:ABC-type sugar transport system substrate-binding protein
LGDALTAHPEIRGVYLSAAGPTGVCDLLRERNLLGKVHVICHDATAENCANTRSGAIDFLIDQDAHKQAVRPIEILLDYILTGVRPTEEFQLTHIDIRNRYNV